MKFFKKLSFLLFMITTTLATGQDWPNLARYATDNARLDTLPPDDQRVVFMGNSITEGWIQDSLSFFDNPHYINRGISGQTTPQMLCRFRADVIALKPQAVVILAGINDVAGNTGPMTIQQTLDNLYSMAELAKAHGIKVILSSVLPAADFPWRPGMEPAGKVMQINEHLKQYAIKHELTYLDYFSTMADKNNGLQAQLTYDGVHPNLAGYKIMAPLANAAIQKAQKK